MKRRSEMDEDKKPREKEKKDRVGRTRRRCVYGVVGTKE